MLPLVGIPRTIAKFLKSYRKVFGKEAGFKHISRYISGLVISPNKTLQGIYSQLVLNEENTVSRRRGCRHQKPREIWAFTKVVRLKKYSRKRFNKHSFQSHKNAVL